MKKQIKWTKWENEIVSNNENDDDDDFLDLKPMIRTHHGDISIKLNANKNENLNWWVGHTNFDIGVLEKNTICDVPGVEIFDLFSPYRFRICVGEAFKTEDVKKGILDKINRKKSRYTKETKSYVARTKKDLMDEYKYWLIYVLPNQKVEVFASDDAIEFTNTKMMFEKTKSKLGGKLIFS